MSRCGVLIKELEFHKSSFIIFLFIVIRMPACYIRKYYDHELLLDIDAMIHISATILH